MPKRVANGLTLLSAVVCVGSALVVGRSFVYADAVSIRAGPRSVAAVRTVQGQLWLLHTGWIPARHMPARLFSSFTGHAPSGWRIGVADDNWRYIWGNRWLGVGGGRVLGTRMLILPLWLLPFLTAIPPVRWWRARRREGGRGFAVEGARPFR